jgi:hypothetical protein
MIDSQTQSKWLANTNKRVAYNAEYMHNYRKPYSRRKMALRKDLRMLALKANTCNHSNQLMQASGIVAVTAAANYYLYTYIRMNKNRTPSTTNAAIKLRTKNNDIPQTKPTKQKGCTKLHF